MSAEGSTRAVVAALAANLGIAASKFVAFFMTGSSSMLAEAVHSLADTSNEALLLIGQRQASKKADALHQFGSGRSRFFYSFIVALVLFSMGSVFAVYEGYHKITHPHESLSSPMIAIVILVVAMVLEGYSLYVAVKESRPLKGKTSWWQFIRKTRNPELPVVLLENFGALIGLASALAGVGLTMLTDNTFWDGLATIGIGLLLGVIAIILASEMHSLLIGEAATPEQYAAIHAALTESENVDRVIHMRTQCMSPEDIVVGAKIALPPESDLKTVAATIDNAEARVRAVVPAVSLIYIEPDLDRWPAS
jgi:cation diffusion facilitator family transporter